MTNSISNGQIDVAEGRRALASPDYSPRPWATGPSGDLVLTTHPDVLPGNGHVADTAEAPLIAFAVNNLPALLDAYEERGKLLAAIGLQTEEAQGVLDGGGAEGMLRFVTARAAMGDYYTRQAEILQAENEQMGTELELAKLASEPVYSRRKLEAERDQLRAEVERLKTENAKLNQLATEMMAR